ncbi:DUF4388 domain-containing protein [Myxococcus sp. K15C18031901]|uniref:DUF4388 domain-containing protein n=1 Tax=Myxococcus dinghuensis TaxID=2906761 RepID=UPI0020A7159C|nr:DUF4388 domain-containing protein [Myxococcus dinghuensis]MCP3104572.1 DUF4388 domain-containing protein [Myxococcus dinghuensis]
MFPTPSQVLRQREGLLSDTPFPLLLHALMVEERTCTLELKVRQREKRILFEDGSPVACQSNLLHETLGKYLVEKGRLSEADYQKCLAESVSSGVRMGPLLIQKSLISPFDLYKQLQANLAHKLLDCFRWVDARYRLIADVEESPDASVRTNTAQLVLTGVANVMPFDAVATHFTFTDERRFGQTPGVESGPKLSSKDARLFQMLRQRPTFGELQERTGFDTETVLRRLYALCLLGVAGFVEDTDARARELAARVQAAPPPAPEPGVAPPPEPARSAGTPFADEDVAVRDALVGAFLAHRGKDPFALLEVPEDVQPAPLRRAFLGWTERHSPLRFQHPELKEKAETLLVAYARAYAALADTEQALLWRKRRAAQRDKEKGATGRPSTAEQFRIRTELLDATTQFDEAKRRLAARNFAGAFEYFEYACDIEPRALYQAYRAWARYLMKPESHGRLALQELQELTRQEPALEEGWAFLGEVAQGEGQWALAEDAFRKAFKLNPKNRRYVELVQELVKRR